MTIGTPTFSKLYFTKSSTDVYATLAGGQEIPEETEYDKTNSLSWVQLYFTTYDSRGLQTGGTAGGDDRNAAQHRINTFEIGMSLEHVTWNSSRTELTIPLGFDLIKDASEAQWHNQTEYFGLVTRNRVSDDIDSTRVHADIWAEDVGEQIFNIDRLMSGAYVNTENGSGAGGEAGHYSVTFKSATQLVSWGSNDSDLIPLNGPSGTSVFAANGFSLSNIADASSSAGATGDPHITTFGGDRYTL